MNLTIEIRLLIFKVVCICLVFCLKYMLVNIPSKHCTILKYFGCDGFVVYVTSTVSWSIVARKYNTLSSRMAYERNKKKK